jgi:hypothetical protein
MTAAHLLNHLRNYGGLRLMCVAILMTGLGLVSRVSPVHTALRNCTRDEGRSFEVGNQVLISSHRKLLSRRAASEDSKVNSRNQ